jgi:beta-glucanase (GH16 family)
MRPIYSKYSALLLILWMLCSVLPKNHLAAAQGSTVVFRDDFSGSALDSSLWSVGNWKLGRAQLGNTPIVSGGIARLTFDTFGFKGTEIYSKQLFSRGVYGLELEGRVRLGMPLPSGLVTSIFTYVENSVGASDEIDIGILTKQVNAAVGGAPVGFTTWNDFTGTCTVPYKSTQTVFVSGLDVSAWHSYVIRWQPGKVVWLIDGNVVATDTLVVPDANTPVRLNFWAPGSGWTEAYDANFQPATTASSNARYYYDVDYVEVRQLTNALPVPAPIKPAPKPIKPAPAPIKPAPKPIKPVPTPIKPAPKPSKPVPTPIKPAPKPIKPVPTPIKTAPAPRPAKPLALPSKPISSSRVLLRDDFSGSTLDSSLWTVGNWKLGRAQLGNTPIVNGGIARLTFDTFGFKGTEIYTNRFFSRGTFGLEVEGRVRLNMPLPAGLVTSIFTYIANSGKSDEIDIEFLTKQVNAAVSGAPIDFTTWNDFSDTYSIPYYSTQRKAISGLDVSTWHTYVIQWLPGKTVWWIDGVVVATDTQVVPDADTQVHLNFWAPESTWTEAYDASFQPTTDVSLNVRYYYDVDYVEVRELTSSV